MEVLMAVSESIRELKQVPSGVLYAQLMGVMDLATYNRIVQTLKDAGVVREQFHVLHWIDPKPLTAKQHNATPKGRW